MIAGAQGTVSPAQILTQVSEGRAAHDFSTVLLDRLDSQTGTPDAKVRIGIATAVDYTAWTCSVQIAGSPTVVPNIPLMSEIVPYVGRKYLLLQIGPEYVVLGVLGVQHNQPRGRMLISSGSVPANSAFNTVQWTDDVYLDGIGGGEAVNRWEIIVPGEYELKARLAYAVNTTGFRALQIRETSSVPGLVNLYTVGSTSTVVNHSMELSVKRKFLAGDIFITEVAQNSGVTLAYNISGLDNNSFTAHRVGPL